MNHFYKAMAQLSHRYWQQYYEDCVLTHTIEFNKRLTQMSNKNPVGYVDKRVLMEFIQEHMPDGKYIRIGMDHPGCWVDDEPYNHLIPLYTEPKIPRDLIEERAAFEAWFIEETKITAVNSIKLDRDKNGNYLFCTAYDYWRVWQARAENV